MDFKEDSSKELGQSRQEISIFTFPSSGCNLALQIAFTHLKKRFTVQSEELSKLRSVAMNVEVPEEYNSILLLERKVEQLQRSLQNKITAYNNLEATYKQTRENEEALIKQTADAERLLLEAMRKSIAYQKESSEFKEKVSMLKLEVRKLEEEKQQLGEELNESRNVPEVSVLRDLPTATISDEISPWNSYYDMSGCEQHHKQIEALLYENKTLKTSMYWLATELKTVKHKEGGMPRRVRHDSGGLEEGRAGQTLNEYGIDEACKCFKNIVAYTRKLERTISSLKAALNKNNVIINSLLLKKFGHVPKILKKCDSLGCSKMAESYVTIDGEDACGLEFAVENTDHVIIWEDGEEDAETYKLHELESTSVIVPLDQLRHSSDGETDVDNDEIDHRQIQFNAELQHMSEDVDFGKNGKLCSNMQKESLNYLLELDENDTDHQHEHDSLNESYGNGALKKFNCPCHLPLSLLQNLELQQTKTYLTSRKSAKCVGNDYRGIKVTSPVGSIHAENSNILYTLNKKAEKENCVKIT